MKPIIRYFAVTLMLFFACAKQVVKQPAVFTGASPAQTHASVIVTKKLKKDTLCYVVEFQDSTKRQQFAAAVEQLLKNVPAQPSSDSTNTHAVKIQLVKSSIAATALGRPLTIDSAAAQHGNQPASKIGPAAPVFGGSVRFYTPRGFIGHDIGQLLYAFPFGDKTCDEKGKSAGAGYLMVNTIADKGLSLSLAPTVKNAAGRPVSAFDLVTGWTDFIKKHPAEGKALFRYVKGVDQFIGGHEAVITGFQIVDEKTVVLQLTQSDPNAVQRLCTSRLFQPSFKLGPYFITDEKNNVLTLAPNGNYPLGSPYLNSCEIISGKDANPFLSYSLHRYNVMAIFSLKDIDYASRMASDKSNLSVFSADRYFLSLAMPSVEVRQFINRILDKYDILTNHVKAEGSPIKSVEAEDAAAETTGPAAPSAKSALAIAPPFHIHYCHPLSQRRPRVDTHRRKAPGRP